MLNKLFSLPDFKLEKLEDLDDDIADTLEQFEKKIRRHVLHTVAFY